MHTGGRRAGSLALGALAVLGAASRLAPFLDQGGRLLRQFPTEDGYLMLTMARNIALGHGMSIAAGTIPSNGTQPLATYLFAGAFALVGGEKKAGVAAVLAIEVVLAVLATFLLYRLARRLLGERRLLGGPSVAALVALAWWASPVVVRHGMNGLETGLYAAAAIGVLAAFLGLLAPDAPPGRRLPAWAGLGALLGLAFWARNDAVLLCGAVGLVHLLGLGASAAWRARDRVLQLACAAGATVLVAAPWLANNLLRFGHVMPISGQAESLRVAFAENLSLVAPKLFEYLTLVLLIPQDLEGHPAVLALTVLATLAAAAGTAAAMRGWPAATRSLAAAALLYAASLAAFYGLWFGAGHFMSRYLFPASPFAALLLGAAAYALLERGLPQRLGRLALAGGLLLFIGLAAGLNVRLYVQGDEHAHFQVVRWVERHVPESTWVGAIQTGTLGFFHDRTINLDGKVNPEALRAREAGRIPEYVVEQPIDYLADWVGIAGWIEKPPIDQHFELLLADESRNLAVLRRRGAPGTEPAGAPGG